MDLNIVYEENLFMGYIDSKPSPPREIIKPVCQSASLHEFLWFSISQVVFMTSELKCSIFGPPRTRTENTKDQRPKSSNHRKITPARKLPRLRTQIQHWCCSITIIHKLSYYGPEVRGSPLYFFCT